jgi:pimeloyl-ACP methyl ester carboxylesterase
MAWTPCGGGFECATLAVPLNYAEAAGRKIDLAVIRLPARDPANRIGALAVNPGGPGGSAIEFARVWALGLPAMLRDRFDIVAFDPRGVGQSTPLLCHDGIQAFAALDPNPDSPEEWTLLREGTQRFIDACAQRGGDLLPHLGTSNVARDMDQLRRAMGDAKLTYVGYSYGTMIGAVYADLFPDRVRAFVLDGASDVSLSGDQWILNQALGFERALGHYFADCRARRCITAYPDDPEAGLKELLRRAEAAPIPAPGGDRPAGPGETFLAVVQSLYADSLWPLLTRAINNGLAGDGSSLISLADIYLARNPDGSYDNLIEANLAVNCVDEVYSRDPLHYERLAAQFAPQAPYFGAAFGAGILSCGLWPAPASPVPDPRGAGAPPILVIGTTGDPATPYEWAVALADDLESGVLLTYHGEGHTAYTRGNACVNQTVNTYLLTLQPPAPNTACGDPARVPIPTPGPRPSPIPTP